MRWPVLGFLLLSALSCSETGQRTIDSSLDTETGNWYAAIEPHSVLGLSIADQSMGASGWNSKDSLVQGIGSDQRVYLKWKNDGQHLSEIILSFIDERLSPDSSFQYILGHLDQLYGPSRPTAGYATWKIPSQTGSLVEVELMDGLSLYNRPGLIARWKEIKDRKYEP